MRTFPLQSVLKETRELLMKPGNDFSGAYWANAQDAASDVDALIADLDAGIVPRQTLVVMFSPTGPLGEISARSGWANSFVGLTKRLNDALAASDAKVMRRNSMVSSPDLEARDRDRTA